MGDEGGVAYIAMNLRPTPARAVLLGALPGDPRVDDDGTVFCDAPGSAFTLLVPPALFVGLNALILTFSS